MEDTLLEKTGKSLEQWIAVVRATGLAKHTEILNHLKSKHGLTHGFANLISLKARGTDAGSFEEDELIAAQYSKGKEALKPIYDRLIEVVSEFGDDVEIAPKKANVSLRRHRQFALIQPSTKTRIDLGLKYDQAPVSDRILDSGSFGAMCTNRVQITDLEQVDDELVGFLREAYAQAGKK